MTEIEIIVVLLIRGKNTHLLTGWLRPLETQKGKRLWLGLYKLIPKFVFQAEYVFLYQWSMYPWLIYFSVIVVCPVSTIDCVY